MILKLIDFKIIIFSTELTTVNLFDERIVYSPDKDESEFLQKLVKDKKIHEARAFNFTYSYIDYVLSINNSRFAELLPLIYPFMILKLIDFKIIIFSTELTTVVKFEV
jgi:hypothetical protein